jgi:hypothetical protein
VSAHPEQLISDNPNPSELVYNCNVGVLPTKLAKTVLRTCTRSTVDTCPEDWADEDVRVQCESYNAHVCLDDTVYRNDYCGICNNNGSFHGLPCSTYNNSIGSEDTSFYSKHENNYFEKYLEDIPFYHEFKIVWSNITVTQLAGDADFTVLLNFKPCENMDKCQLHTKEYDPFMDTWLPALLEPESKCKISSFDLTLFLCFVN